jgi:hypothetical protein
VVVARIRYGPVEARKYLRGIAGNQPREVSGEDFHTVVIDELWRRVLTSQRREGREDESTERIQSGSRGRRVRVESRRLV